MQLTTQTRLKADSAAHAQLSAYAQLYATRLHELYAWVAARGGKARDHKTEFCRAKGISARMFNALAVELQGLLDGTRELLTDRLKDLNKAHKSAQRSLKTAEAQLKKLQAKLPAGTAPAWQKQKIIYQRVVKRIAKCRAKLFKLPPQIAKLEARLAANVPGIGFGSRKLFAKQHHLAENGFKDHAEWLAAWRAARAHQMAFLGSKDETAGNLNCSLFEGENGTFRLRVRLPDSQLADGQDKYLWLEGITFPSDEAAIRAALKAGQALSYKLHYADKHWRLLVSFERQAAPVQTRERTWGCIGVDFNADHLGVAETDLYGNIVKAWRIELPFEDKSSGQRKAILSDALQEVVKYAIEHKKPIVIEDLDFRGKKKQLASMSPVQARMLSGLAYAQYQQLMASKCFRFGLELFTVNPAYTSVAGRLKYAVPFGRSVHLAAAGVIARRGMGLTEKPPGAESVRIPVRGTTVCYSVPVRKAGDSRAGAWARIGRDLTVFLRQDYLAAQKAKSEKTAGTAGAKGRIASGLRARRPSEGTVPERLPQNPMLFGHDQVLRGSI